MLEITSRKMFTLLKIKSRDKFREFHKKKVIKFLYRLIRFAGSCGSQILRQLVHEGDQFVSPTHRPPLPSTKYSWYSFVLET